MHIIITSVKELFSSNYLTPLVLVLQNMKLKKISSLTTENTIIYWGISNLIKGVRLFSLEVLSIEKIYSLV